VKRISALAALLAFAAGCGGSAPPAPPSSDPPPGVSVSLAQWRSDEAAHVLQVAVRNTSDVPVHFADLQLVTPSFAVVPAEKAGSTIKRTPRTDLPIPFGKAHCPAQGLPEVRPATVVAHLRTGQDQRLRKVVFPVPHPDPLLARLLRDECSEHLIKQAAGISFGPRWERHGDVMRGTLTLTRQGPGTVTVHTIDGTTHYIATGEGKPLVTLDATAQRAETAVELTPGRCDPHAFAEAKKAFLFPVRASVDGGEERVVIVTPPEADQERLIDYALDVCGLGG
jgi:hypothetical protein